MLSFEKAQKIIESIAAPLAITTMTLDDALGYVLARDIKTKTPVPRFDSSAVDGYAIRCSDVKEATKGQTAILNVQTVVKAGDGGSPTLKSGHAIRIFTGARLPRGADAVVMQEKVRENNGVIHMGRSMVAGENIRPKGEEFTSGEKVLNKGTFLTPPVIGLLATLGVQKVAVHRKPRVAVIVTGNELRSVGVRLPKGCIYDSNSHSLVAALRMLGLTPVYVRRVRDDARVLRTTLRAALAAADMVITVGGISVGEYDLVKEQLAALGVKTVFWKVAMKPGKPNYLGVRGRKLVFGLPGNPTAALLSFHLLVGKALRQMMGDQGVHRRLLMAVLTAAISKKKGRIEFVRGLLSFNNKGALLVTPVRGRDSHMLGSIALADSLIHVPTNISFLRAGTPVLVSLLHWGLS